MIAIESNEKTNTNKKALQHLVGLSFVLMVTGDLWRVFIEIALNMGVSPEKIGEGVESPSPPPPPSPTPIHTHFFAPVKTTPRYSTLYYV